MEKDKLMELLEEITNERKGIENAIEKQRNDKAEKGLSLIHECLKYVQEMAKYFNVIEYSSACLNEPICDIQFRIANGNACVNVGSHYWGYYQVVLNDFEKYNFNDLIKSKETRFDYLRLSAIKLADSDFTLSKLQKIVNELLAKLIVSYKEKNDKLKESLK
jgi:hypothetical protein